MRLLGSPHSQVRSRKQEVAPQIWRPVLIVDRRQAWRPEALEVRQAPGCHIVNDVQKIGRAERAPLFLRRWVPRGCCNHGGLECLQVLGRTRNPPLRAGAFKIRLIVAHILQSLDGYAVLCTVLGIAMGAPEPVARGKEPVAMTWTGAATCIVGQ